MSQENVEIVPLDGATDGATRATGIQANAETAKARKTAQ
jgi:hypothetical protein